MSFVANRNGLEPNTTRSCQGLGLHREGRSAQAALTQRITRTYVPRPKAALSNLRSSIRRTLSELRIDGHVVLLGAARFGECGRGLARSAEGYDYLRFPPRREGVLRTLGWEGRRGIELRETHIPGRARPRNAEQSGVLGG